MPRGRAGPSTSRRGPEEEEDMNMSQMSQATQSLTQAQRAADSLPQEVVDRKVSDLVQYMLTMESKKIAVKRADLSKNVMKEHRNILAEVLQRAAASLKKIFGYELVEVEHSTGKSKTKLYFLLNTLKSEMTKDLVKEPDQAKLGLLYVILSLIFMNEGSLMSDGQMWNLLQKLGVSQDQNHAVFGDVKKLVTQDFTKQMYLDMKRIPNTEPVEYEFRWGPRAERELDKEHVLNLVARIHGPQKDPKIWKTQYRQVLIAKGIDPDQDANGHDGENEGEDDDEAMEEEDE